MGYRFHDGKRTGSKALHCGPCTEKAHERVTLIEEDVQHSDVNAPEFINRKMFEITARVAKRGVDRL